MTIDEFDKCEQRMKAARAVRKEIEELNQLRSMLSHRTFDPLLIACRIPRPCTTSRDELYQPDQLKRFDTVLPILMLEWVEKRLALQQSLLESM